MEKDALRIELNNLERRVKMILSEFAKSQNEISRLKAENEALREQLESNSSQLASFQNQAKITKIVDSMIVEEGGSMELKEVIESYIKEIDKCLAHLGEV